MSCYMCQLTLFIELTFPTLYSQGLNQIRFFVLGSIIGISNRLVYLVLDNWFLLFHFLCLGEISIINIQKPFAPLSFFYIYSNEPVYIIILSDRVRLLTNTRRVILLPNKHNFNPYYLFSKMLQHKEIVIWTSDITTAEYTNKL